jgi:hypothetical protein
MQLLRCLSAFVLSASWHALCNNILKEVNAMDKAKMKFLVSILKESPFYQSISHKEKIALLSGLLEEYPSLFIDQEQSREAA